MRAGTLLVCGLGALGVAALAGCPTFGVDVCEGDACGTTGGDDGGKDGATDGGQILPAGCDLTKDPSESPACVDDTVGVFVSATGSDGAAGTKSAPVKTLSAALGKVSTQRSRVYVCEGTYAGAVTIDGSQSSALSGVYGGFTCSDWKTGGAKAKLVAGAGEVVLTVKSVASSLVVTDLDVEATSVASTGDAGASDGGAGGSAGASSIAAMVLSSKGVVLRRVKLVGGDASDGAPTPKTSNYDEALAATDPKIKGHDATNNTGAAPQDCVALCINGVHATGGGGGGLLVDGQDGGPSLPPSPAATPPHDGVAGTASCATGAHAGAAAPSAAGGAPINAASGKLTTTGWTRVDGASGGVGGPGMGGGGGGGGDSSGGAAGGGSGGCGGCGGAGGAGGMSGGSSFALLSYQSTVTLDACDLHAGKGGSGQAGGNGQVGQTGGNRGEPASGGTGCPGAAGGKGGDGAGGGGGAGGHASAVGYVGTAPATSNGTTLGKGTAGQGAAGGSGGTPPAGAGANGQAVESLKLE